MAIRQGKCTNFGNCATADKKQLVQVAEGTDFACTECGRPLTDMTPQARSGPQRGILVAIVLVLLIGGVILWKVQGGHPTTAGSTILRLAGSNTIGAKLAPALAQEFLKDEGAVEIKILPGEKE